MAPADLKYLFCSFRPPRGMLWPLPAAVCAVVGLRGGDDNDEADFQRWCSNPDYFPWSAAELAELCLDGRLREAVRAGFVSGRVH